MTANILMSYDEFDNLVHSEEFMSSSKKYHLVWHATYAPPVGQLLSLLTSMDETSETGKSQKKTN